MRPNMVPSDPNNILPRLPIEVLQIVLSNLSVKDIARVRVLSQQVSQAIDANQNTVLQPVVVFHQGRIATCCNNALNTTDVDVATAFKTFIGYCGGIHDVAGGTDVLMSFCWLYVWQNYMYKPDLGGSDAAPRHLRDALYYATRDSIQHLPISSSTDGDRDNDLRDKTESRLIWVADFLNDDTWRHLLKSLAQAHISIDASKDP